MAARRSALSRLLTIALLLQAAGAARAQDRGTGAPVRDTPRRAPGEAGTNADGAGALTGRVVRADDGQPLRRVEVVARSDGRGAWSATTNGDGRFEIPFLPTGVWTLTLSKPGYALPLPAQTLSSRTVRINAGEATTYEGTLKAGGAVTGFILDEQGDPVAGVAVEALYARLANGRKQLIAVTSDLTDDTGAYRLHSLPAGDFYVAARQRTVSPEEAGLPSSLLPTFYPGTASIGDAWRVPVRTREERSGINLSLTSARAVRVSGTVASSSGRPADEATVELISASDNTVVARPFGNFGLTQGGGRFGMINVAPGSYMLSARVDSPDGDELAVAPIVVGSTDASDVTIATRPGATVNGTIVAAGAASLPPLTNTRIDARPARNGAARQSAEPAANRTVTLSGLVGPVFIDVYQLPAGWALLRIEMEGKDITDAAVDLPAGSRASLRVIVTDQISRLTGLVTAPGSLAADAGVLVFPADASRWTAPSRSVRVVRTDATGRFRVDGLPGGDYLAIALEGLAEDEWVDAPILERIRGEAQPVTLTDGMAATLTLPLMPR